VEGLDVKVTQLSMGSVSVEFGANTLFENVSFTVSAGERWGIIGRNGAGKTSLFRLLTGELGPTRGEIARSPSLRVSLLEQHRDFGDATTIWEAAAGQFAELLQLERSLSEQAQRLAVDSNEQALARYGRDLERFEREGGYMIAPRVEAVLHGLGFDPVAARERPIAQLSGGERGRLGLARQLVSPADVLLLDEPTNHLDLETTRWLEDYLTRATATVLLISHDRAFLSTVVDHVLHLEGRTATPYAGGYESFVEQRMLARLTQQRQFDQQRRVIAAEQDYIARNLAGQNSKQAKGRRKRLERLPRLSAPLNDADSMAIQFETFERGGDRVVTAEKASIGVAGRTLIEVFTATLMRGDRVGLIGPNGSGKSTLVRAIVGDHPVKTGAIRVGGGVSVGYYRQDLTQVPLDKTLYDIIGDLRPTWDRRLVQGHLGRFGFSGDEVQRRAEGLSGGERARIGLAMLMLSGANLLILDEPTNHLDVESIEALEDAVASYDGSVLLVSHDRELLRSLTTKLWIVHDQRLTEFDGSFGEWEIVSAEREHAAAVQASEEEALRRVRERRRTERREERDRTSRTALRTARERVGELEDQIQTAEQEMTQITVQLENPELYATTEGISTAKALGTRLEMLKIELDALLEEWDAATQALETIAGPGA
jgi:ATP-binding cassette subfamily F protein 3